MLLVTAVVDERWHSGWSWSDTSNGRESGGVTVSVLLSVVVVGSNDDGYVGECLWVSLWALGLGKSSTRQQVYPGIRIALQLRIVRNALPCPR